MAKKHRTVPQVSPAPVRSTSDTRHHLLAAVALYILTLLAYSNSFHAGFVLDNKGLILDDPRIRAATSDNINLIGQHTYWWPTGEAGLYRPFTTLSYLFNYAILEDRDQPEGYHWINLLLHLTNVLLAYALALRLALGFWPAVFISALWAVHPASTESVTNLIGRADLLAGFAGLSGFFLYLKSAQAKGWTRWLWLAGLAAVTSLGVFSKESAVAILPVIVLYELTWWKERHARRPLLWGCLATALPIAGMLYQRWVVLSASPPAELPFTDNPIVGADWWIGRLTAIKVMARYLLLTVWPARLSPDYSYNQIPLAHGRLEDWAACAAVFAFAVVVLLLYRVNRTAFFLSCFAFLNFVPASNLLFPIGTIMADRILYLPSFGLLACVVLAIYTFGERLRMPVLPPILLCIIAAGFAVRTWVRNQDWQTNLTLASAGVRACPNSFKLDRMLAMALFESDPSHSNLDQVIAEEDKALALLDTLPDARNRPDAYRVAGYHYLLKGDPQKALHAILKSISIDQAGRGAYRASANPVAATTPEADSRTYLLLSSAYLRSGDAAKALVAATKARELDPLNPQIYRQLSDVFLSQRREQEAELASAEEEAITLLREGKWQEAADLTRRIMDHNPAEFPPGYYLNAMANLHTGNLQAAERSAREAVRLDANRRNPRTMYVLGLVLAQKREYAQSAQMLRSYLSSLPNAPDAEVVRRQLAEIEKSETEAKP
jgi:tetratricopeptide (TPR) repeat protein